MSGENDAVSRLKRLIKRRDEYQGNSRVARNDRQRACVELFYELPERDRRRFRHIVLSAF